MDGIANCKRVVHSNRYRKHGKPHIKKNPLRVTDSTCCPPDNGIDNRLERDSAFVDEDGHQAMLNDGKVGASDGVDSQRIAVLVVSMSVAAGVLYLAHKNGLI